MTGYIMIDCTGLNLLASESQTVNGLYAKCVEALETGKPCIACNLIYGAGVPMSPVPVFGIYEDDNIIFTASVLQIVVTPEDGVTIINLAPANTTKTTRKTTTKTTEEKEG